MQIEGVNKVVLRSDDDKTLQTFDGIKRCPYGISLFIVCESERSMLCEVKEKLEMLEKKFEIQTNKCESDMYSEEKEKYEMFFKNMKERCKKEMRKYMKLKNINNDQF